MLDAPGWQTAGWQSRYGNASNEGAPDLVSDTASLDEALERWGLDELVLEVEADGTDDVMVLLRDSVHGGLLVAYLDFDNGDGCWCAYRITEGKIDG